MRAKRHLACLVLAAAALPPFVAHAQPVTFTQNSYPAGFVNQVSSHETGLQLSTTNAPQLTQGYQFAVWRFNGTDQRDNRDRALNPVVFTILENVTATAEYRQVGEDANTNALPDWWELNYHPSLVSNSLSDIDSDGLDLRAEYVLDFHPGLHDAVVTGGLSIGFAPPATVIVAPGFASWLVESVPAGLVPTTASVTNTGTLIGLPDVSSGTINGFRFCYWSINGTIQFDQGGRARGAPTFALQSNTVAQAVFLPADADTNQNKLPDWFELTYFGQLVPAVNVDHDNDGADLLEEYRRDYHPRLVDVLAPGGISVSFGAPTLAITSTNYATFVSGSLPDGLIPGMSTITNRGALVYLPEAYGSVNGYRFAYWSVNGVVQSDVTGRVRGGMALALQSNTIARAIFVPENEDANTNAIPDWYELNFLAHLASTNDADADSDGLDLLAEYRRDSHPRMADVLHEGGISVAFASPAFVIVSSGLVSYAFSSVPTGLIPSAAGVTNVGALLRLPDAFGGVNGYRFCYWSRNGELLTDPWGRTLTAPVLVLASNTVALATFLPEDTDANINTIPDWYEYNFFGTTLPDANADLDSDGFSAIVEFRRDYHPRLADRIDGGGISFAFAREYTVSFQFFPRIRQVLENGLPMDFFSNDPAMAGSFGVAANSHPALGDWDGDGDLDLFVGGSNGTVRVFENAGSPTVVNWVERTSNFTAMAFAWTNAANPAPTLGDWSGDDRDDLAVGGETGGVWLVASPGSFSGPSLSGPQQSAFLALGSGAIPAFGRIDGKERVSLLILTGLGYVHEYTNSTSATSPYVEPPFSTNVLPAPVPNARAMTTADVNEDGRMDILISDQNGNIWEFHGRGP